MKIRCIYNSGKDLQPYETKPFRNSNQFGRFGITPSGTYNEIKIGEEYLVMGLIVFETYQAYLIDCGGFVSACPCQLFEIIDNQLPSSWYFRSIGKDENMYPFIQALFGYPELCLDKKAYEKLIVEKDNDALRAYFKRKIELEKTIEDNSLLNND